MTGYAHRIMGALHNCVLYFIGLGSFSLGTIIHLKYVSSRVIATEIRSFDNKINVRAQCWCSVRISVLPRDMARPSPRQSPW